MIEAVSAAGLMVLVTAGLVLQWGWAGVPNLAAGAFFVSGLVVSARLAEPWAVPAASLAAPAGWPWWTALVVAPLVTGVAALALGTVLGRERLAPLPTAVLALGVVVLVAELPRPGAVPAASGQVAAAAAIVGGAGGALLLAHLRSMPFARAMRAVRADPAAASELGHSPFSRRLAALVAGSAMMGLAGALSLPLGGGWMAAPEAVVVPWAALVAGGSTRPAGAVVGGVAVAALVEAGGATLGQAPSWALAAGGGLLLVLALRFAPQGVVGLLSRSR